jgi:hypothetical protein
MDNLRAVIDGEYSNSADLMGIDTENSDLLGRISKLPKDQQGKALKQLMRRGSGGGSESSRREMEQRFNQLPKEIRDGLLNKRLQLVDTRFYVIKDISGKNAIDVFQGTDQKSVGLGNLANQKLEKDNWFIIYAMRMLYAQNAAGRDTADFIHIVPIILNGEFELEAGNKKLIGLADNTAFDTRNRTDLQIGYYKLENTKIIEPQVEIKMPVRFTAAAGTTTFLKVIFIGTSVIPY